MSYSNWSYVQTPIGYVVDAATGAMWVYSAKFEVLAEPMASAPRLHPNLAEVCRQEVASLTEALGDEGAADAREIVRGLVEQVTVRPDPGAGGPRVEVRGALSAMLALGGGGGAVSASPLCR